MVKVDKVPAGEWQEPERDLADFNRPTSLEDLAAKRVPATIEIRGFPIHLYYDPDAVTAERLIETDQATQGGKVANQLEVMTVMLTEMIVEWDLVEGNGNNAVVELSPERLSKFGIGLLGEILTELGKALRMGEASGTPSQRRSLPTRTKRAYGS